MARWVFLLRAVVVFCLLFAVLVTDPLLFDWDFESRIFTLHPAEFELKTSTRMHWDLVASLKTKNHGQGRDQQRFPLNPPQIYFPMMCLSVYFGGSQGADVTA